MPASKNNLPVREGRLPFRGFTDWFKSVGGPVEAGKFPVLVLHGGPGAAHDYLEPIEALAATGRPVIFYDQLGCGQSDRPHDPSLWDVPLFVEEVGAVRQALGLDRLHILGQSWGGMLGMEYALTQPEGLVSLIIANSPASMTQWVSEANRLRACFSTRRRGRPPRRTTRRRWRSSMGVMSAGPTRCRSVCSAPSPRLMPTRRSTTR
mgnify:CR=1 FL=1